MTEANGIGVSSGFNEDLHCIDASFIIPRPKFHNAIRKIESPIRSILAFLQKVARPIPVQNCGDAWRVSFNHQPPPLLLLSLTTYPLSIKRGSFGGINASGKN